MSSSVLTPTAQTSALVESHKCRHESEGSNISSIELLMTRDFDRQKEENPQSEDSWKDVELEQCEEASTASASTRSIEIREDLNALFNQSSSLEDFPEELVLGGTVTSEVKSQQSGSAAKEMFKYYDGFDIDDLVIPFDSTDKMLCMVKGPVQEKKAKNKFLCLSQGRRSNYSNSPCSSPAYSDGPTLKPQSNYHSNFAKSQQNGSISNFGMKKYATDSSYCCGKQRKIC